jgi:hypothetical protein
MPRLSAEKAASFTIQPPLKRRHNLQVQPFLGTTPCKAFSPKGEVSLQSYEFSPQAVTSLSPCHKILAFGQGLDLLGKSDNIDKKATIALPLSILNILDVAFDLSNVDFV